MAKAGLDTSSDQAEREDTLMVELLADGSTRGNEERNVEALRKAYIAAQAAVSETGKDVELVVIPCPDAPKITRLEHYTLDRMASLSAFATRPSLIWPGSLLAQHPRRATACHRSAALP